MPRCLAGMVFLLVGTLAAQTDPLPSRTIPLQTVTLKPGLALSEALALLHKHTGNLVLDRRRDKTDPVLDLNDTYSFWPALLAIARSANVRLSPYAVEGHLALVDGPFLPIPTTSSGHFRLALKQVTVSRQTEATKPTCVLNVEVAWEPRLQPLLLDTGPLAVRFGPDARGHTKETQAASRGQVNTGGQKALEIEWRFPGPDRSAARIQELTGKLKVITPVKMLEFRFLKLDRIADKNAARAETQEGIRVTLTRIRQDSGALSVDVLIQNPPGGPQFESYQSWLDFNRLWLEKGQKAERVELKPNAEEQLENPTATRAAIRYHFEIPPGFHLPDWTLAYLTPGPIVELEVPFRLQDLPLP